MTAATLDRPVVAPAGDIRLTFPRVLRAEAGKLFSLRSTWWTLGVAVVLQVGMAALIGLFARTVDEDAGPGGLQLDGATLPSVGMQFAQLALVVLAVMVITAEYSSGQIRSTLVAVPTRTPVLAAKAVVLAAVTLVVGTVSGALSVAAGLLVAGDRIGFDLPASETLRILAGGPLYLMAIALLALGVGALIRHTAGAIAILMGLLLVVEPVLAAVPLRVLQEISPFLPSTAGQQLLFDDQTLAAQEGLRQYGAHLEPWAGYGILVAWAVAALVLAGWLLRRRDA